MTTHHIDGLSVAEKKALLAQLLRARRQPAAGQPHDLSYSQQAMWFINRLAPESHAYNVAFSAWIHSPLDVAALAAAGASAFA